MRHLKHATQQGNMCHCCDCNTIYGLGTARKTSVHFYGKVTRHLAKNLQIGVSWFLGKSGKFYGLIFFTFFRKNESLWSPWSHFVIFRKSLKDFSFLDIFKMSKNRLRRPFYKISQNDFPVFQMFIKRESIYGHNNYDSCKKRESIILEYLGAIYFNLTHLHTPCLFFVDTYIFPSFPFLVFLQ